MEPFPPFATRAIPERPSLGPFALEPLGPEHLDEDYAAVIESRDALQGLFPDWPGALTREANALDLAWHAVEFRCRRSLAWAVRREGRYLGCGYLLVRWEGGIDAPWWIRTGAADHASAFGTAWRDWLASPLWAGLDPVVRGPAGGRGVRAGG